MTFPESGKQDSFRHIFKNSASMYESSGSQFFRTTTGIQLQGFSQEQKNLCFAWIAVFSIWKALQVLRKADIKIVACAIYMHLFFSFTYTLLFCRKVKNCCSCYFPQENKNIIVWGLVSIWQSTHTACSNPCNSCQHTANANINVEARC